TTIAEARRVLGPGGLLTILDTPFYSTGTAGGAMLRARDATFRQAYGVDQSAQPSEGFLDRDRWNAVAAPSRLIWRRIDPVNPVIFRCGRFLGESLWPAMVPPGSVVLDL